MAWMPPITTTTFEIYENYTSYFDITHAYAILSATYEKK